MKITMRPMNSEEAWQHILDNHCMYHRKLKQYGYSYDSFIPHADFIIEMFNKEKLTQQELDKYKDTFMNKFYDVTKLQRLEKVFNSSVKQKFEKAINEFLIPLLPSWNATMPKALELRCGYGCGSGYRWLNNDNAVMLFRVSRFSDNPQTVFNIMFHEFVHILIEGPIIKRYNVPQNLKERIVDLICFEFIKKPVQPMFEKSFANAYITPEIIKTNLPDAVAKMMHDYNVLQSTNIHNR